MSASDAERQGLQAAAERFAVTMRKVAAVKTRRTADSVNVTFEGDAAVVAGGHPGGPYGWEPVTALMFDNNLRHPLFGDKKHWYSQGRYPITQYTERAGIDAAADAFADAAIPPLVRDYGFE